MTAQTPATPEISLVEAVWRFRLMSFLIVLVSVLAAVGATQLLLGSAQATARFAVTDPTNSNNVLRQGVISGQGYAAYTAQRAAFAGSTPVMARAAEILREKGGPVISGAALRGRVQTSSKPDGGVVIVNATGEDMRGAALAANAVVQAYQEVTVKTNHQQLDKQLAALQVTKQRLTGQLQVATPGTRQYRMVAADLVKLQERENGVLSARANTNEGVQFVDVADPSAATPSKLPRNGAIGLAIGTILACVVAFLRAAGQARRRGFPAPAPGRAAPYGPGPAPQGYGDLPPGGGYGQLPPGAYADADYRAYADADYRGEVEAPVARAELPRPASAPRRSRTADRSRGGDRGRRRGGARDSAGETMPEAPGRPWGEDANGSTTVAAPPPSTESLLDRAEALLDRPDAGGAVPPSASAPPSASGLLGHRVAGNGTPSRAKPATPRAPGGSPPDSKVAGSKSSRSKGGAHSKNAPADDEPKREIPAELWAEGIDLDGDPTRTVEDNILAAGKDAAAILKELSEEAEKSKGNGSSSLMRYNEG